MTTKAELEQELQIAEAELDQAKKERFEQACEIDRLRGQLEHVRTAAENAGVSLALVPATPAEADLQALEHIRTGINRDLQALDELRNPPPIAEGTAESSLDIVRANQRERAELQARMAKANGLLSRIASAFRFDRWDDAVDKIVDRVNHFAALELRVERKISALRKQPEDTAFSTAWISALEWVQGTSQEKPALDTSVSRLINFVVNGHDTPVEAKPEHTLRFLLELALVRAQIAQPIPLTTVDAWLVYDESGARLKADMIARELKATRVIATLPVGVGA